MITAINNNSLKKKKDNFGCFHSPCPGGFPGGALLPVALPVRAAATGRLRCRVFISGGSGAQSPALPAVPPAPTRGRDPGAGTRLRALTAGAPGAAPGAAAAALLLLPKHPALRSCSSVPFEAVPYFVLAGEQA